MILILFFATVGHGKSTIHPKLLYFCPCQTLFACELVENTLFYKQLALGM